MKYYMFLAYHYGAVAGASPTTLITCSTLKECNKTLEQYVSGGATIEFLQIIKGEEIKTEKQTETISYTKTTGYKILE